MLIINLQNSTILMVNNAWDGTSSVIESLFAYFVLGERFDNYFQYIGVFFIVIGFFTPASATAQISPEPTWLVVPTSKLPSLNDIALK